MEVRLIMEDGLWVAGRCGRIDPLDAVAIPLGFTWIGFFKTNGRELSGPGLAK